MIAALSFLVFAGFSDSPILVDGELCHPRNLLVKYDSASTLLTLKQRATVIRVIPEIRYAVVQARPGMLRFAKKQLAGWRGVSKVCLDRCARPAYDPNDEFWPNQWDMQAIRANFAWDTQRGSPNVTVAVIDTGVYTAHPDLAPNVWINSGEIPGNGIDDDGDGYIDDVNGYDFSHNDGDPDDVYGHGTACSGLVAAAQDNSIGVSGVAPYCRIMALKAATDSGYFYDSNDVPAYIFAANHGARVLSMSFFSDRVSPAEEEALDYCFNHGVLPVAAAGNSASVYPYYPAAYDHVLSVAAVDGGLNKAWFSNYGSWVKVSAPGVGLYTTTNDGGYTSGFAGTSGACPHVAGLAALCFSERPAATPADVMAAIEDTATAQSQIPFGEFSNYGLVDAEAAVLRMDVGPVKSHPTAVRYVSLFSSIPLGLSSKERARIMGRGFDSETTLTSNGRPVPILGLARDHVDFYPPAAPGEITVWQAGTQVGSFVFPRVTREAYPLSEASAPGAAVYGGFVETLNADGHSMVVTQQSDNTISLQGTFHNVAPTQRMTFTLRRRYTGTAGGTETVYLYDWSSASYPYGNFIAIGLTPVSGDFATSTFTVDNAQRFVDPNGTMYLLVATTNDLDTGAQMELDMAYAESR